jgi:hypothetical protein
MKVGMAQWRDDTDRRKKENLGEESVPLPLCPQQTLHGLIEI